VSYSRVRVLVTGGTGFIGGRLVERLTYEEGADVLVAVRDWRRATWVSRTSAALVEADVTDQASLHQVMSGRQVVFHCVGIGGSAETCRRVNVEGTRNVLHAALGAGVDKVVYLSSIAVHGPNPPDNANEEAPLVRTGTPYGDSKVAAEEEIRSFERLHSLPVVILRPTFVWGPRSQWFTVNPVRRILAGDWPLVDGGAGTCHAVYVDNLVDAMLLAGRKEGLGRAAFLVTDDQPCTWAEFFMEYARMAGVDRLPSVSSASTLAKSRIARALDRTLGSAVSALARDTPAHEPLRFLVRGTRFSIRNLHHWARPGVPFSDWDVVKYARIGRLDTTAASRRLGYEPRVSRAEGMRATESWLRDQRIIP